MAFSSIGTLGKNQSKTAAGTLVITTTAAAEVGNVIVVEACWDNGSLTTGDSTDFSVADSAGNTYTRCREYVYAPAGSNSGVHVGIFRAVVTTQLSSGGTITISGQSVTARAGTAWEFSKGSGTTLSVEQTNVGTGAGDPGTITLSSMTSREYLEIWLGGVENASVVYTQGANFSALDTIGTTGGGGASNVTVGGGYRIYTLTDESIDPATDPDGDHAQLLVAIYEVGGGQTTPKEISATAGTTAVRVLLVGKSASASTSTTASVQKLVAKVLAGSAGLSGFLTRQVGKSPLTTTVGAASTVQAMRVYLRELAATVGSAATRTLGVGKFAVTTVGTGASLSRASLRTLGAAIGTVATLVASKTYLRTLLAQVGAASTVQALKVYLRALSATVGSTATMARTLARVRTLSAAIGVSGLTQRTIGKTLPVSVPISALVSKLMARTLVGQVSTTGTVSKRISKTVSTVVSVGATLTKAFGQITNWITSWFDPTAPRGADTGDPRAPERFDPPEPRAG